MLLNKVIFIIGTARSCATMLLRCFDARNDVITFNDLSMPVYINQTEPNLSPLFYWDSVNSYTEARSFIAEAARRRPVVIKETACVAHEFFKSNPDWLRHSQIVFLFVFRNPMDIGASLEQLMGGREMHNINTKLGFEAMMELANKVRNPVFIDAKNLCQAPIWSLQYLCRKIGCEYTPCMMYWGTKVKWRESKCTEQMFIWHRRLCNTRSIGIMMDSDEIMNEKLKKLCEDNKEIYLRLFERQNVGLSGSGLF